MYKNNTIDAITETPKVFLISVVIVCALYAAIVTWNMFIDFNATVSNISTNWTSDVIRATHRFNLRHKHVH